MSLREQCDILGGTIFTNIHAITLLLYSNKYLMPKEFYLNIVYFIIFKWNIELL